MTLNGPEDRRSRSPIECAKILIEEARVVFVHLSIEEREGVAPVVRKKPRYTPGACPSLGGWRRRHQVIPSIKDRYAGGAHSRPVKAWIEGGVDACHLAYGSAVLSNALSHGLRVGSLEDICQADHGDEH